LEDNLKQMKAGNFSLPQPFERLKAATITCFGDGAFTVFGDMRPPILSYSCSINPKRSTLMQLFYPPPQSPTKISISH